MHKKAQENIRIDYEIDPDLSCPKCGHSPLHSRRCNNIFCEQGSIDESEEDYLLPGTTIKICNECKGTGIVRWCPGCGEDLSGQDFDDDENDDDEIFSDRNFLI